MKKIFSLGICAFIATHAFAGLEDHNSPTMETSQPSEKDLSEQNLNLTESALAAQEWLKAVDAHEYGKSWDLGSAVFKLTISREEWTTAMKAMREPLGNVISRKVVDQRTAANPQGLPAGEYIVLFYSTSFSNRSKANELLTLVKEKDGQWRVLTYNAS